jgi:predicted O-methyltransferase YrrM
VREGGIIAIDNVFWSGKVADAATTDNRTKIIRSLNAKIQRDERVNISIIPIGDGLTLAMKKTSLSLS